MLEISLSEQAVNVVLAVFLGGTLAFAYELLSLFRRAVRNSFFAGFTDLFFCSIAFLSFAAFCMIRTCGAVRTDAATFVLIGFFLLRRVVRPAAGLIGKLFRFLFKLLCLPLIPLTFFMKKMQKSFQKLFQKRKDWCIINRTFDESVVHADRRTVKCAWMRKTSPKRSSVSR